MWSDHSAFRNLCPTSSRGRIVARPKPEAGGAFLLNRAKRRERKIAAGGMIEVRGGTDAASSGSRSVSQEIIVVRSIQRQRWVAGCPARGRARPEYSWLAGRPGTPKGRIDTLTETVLGPVARGLHLADLSAPRFAERVLRNIRPGSRGSLRLDVGGPEHLGPVLNVVRDEFPQFGGRACKGRIAAQIGKTRLHFGVGQTRVDLLI